MNKKSSFRRQTDVAKIVLLIENSLAKLFSWCSRLRPEWTSVRKNWGTGSSFLLNLDPKNICQWIFQTLEIWMMRISNFLLAWPRRITKLFMLRLRRECERVVIVILATPWLFLVLLRQNLPQNLIGFMFNTNQQVVSEAVDTVSKLLEELFVPLYLGYTHISRNDAIRLHSRQFFHDLFQNPGENLLGLVLDGTYLYIQKPEDFELQRKTYSAHKYANLF